MRFHVENFGCRSNQADGAALAEQLRAAGHARAAAPEQADLVILNTCTVTAAADQQVRQRIRQLHRQQPRGGIVVTGCYAQRAPQELALLPGVACVVGNSHKSEIPLLLERELHAAPAARRATAEAAGLDSRRGVHLFQFNPVAPLSRVPPAGHGRLAGSRDATGELSIAERPAKIITSDIFTATTLAAGPVPKFNPVAPATGEFANDNRTRPTLKIQDGCNHRCAYCVIPFVRGRARSLPPEEVLAAIRRWVAAGVQEVVLSGLDLGSYGRDLPAQAGLPGLARQKRSPLLVLTERILAETPLPRLRFSSIEPADLTPEFLRLLAASDRIARHIHAPLQSGSNRILRRMYRPYRAEDYAARIRAAAEKLPNLGLGADVIVGFPGETESDFAATCRLVEQLPFSYLHVFSFSKRPGTRACDLSDEVPLAAIQQRARTLRALAAEKQRRFRQAQVGRSLKLLTLRRPRADSRIEALSENYLKVVLDGVDVQPNRLLWVRITGVEGDRLLGVPVPPPGIPGCG